MAKGDSSLVYVEEASVKRLQAIDRALKTMSDEGRKAFVKEMARAIKANTAGIESDIKTAAKDLNFAKTGGGRSGQSRANREARVLKSGKKKLARGLREEMAFGVRTQIDRSKYSAGVRIRMASKFSDVNRLAKLANNKGFIRHPLFGNKARYYTTPVNNGRNWFYAAALPKLPGVRDAVAQTLDQYARKIASTLDRAH